MLECDKSFSRSGPLAKHVRVHEKEILQAIEQGAKRSGSNATMPALASAGSKPAQKLKLVFGSNKSTAPATPVEKVEPDTALLGPRNFPVDCRFTDVEAALPVDQLFDLLRHQIHWATQESTVLEDDITTMESKRKTEWLGKELVLENILEAEFEGAKRRKVFSSGRWARESSVGDIERDKLLSTAQKVQDDAKIASKLPMKGETGEPPWYRSEAWRIKKAAAREAKPQKDLEARAKHVAEESRREEDEDEEIEEGDGEGDGDGEDEEEDDHDDGDPEDDEDDRTRHEGHEVTEG